MSKVSQYLKLIHYPPKQSHYAHIYLATITLGYANIIGNTETNLQTTLLRKSEVQSGIWKDTAVQGSDQMDWLDIMELIKFPCHGEVVCFQATRTWGLFASCIAINMLVMT